MSSGEREPPTQPFNSNFDFPRSLGSLAAKSCVTGSISLREGLVSAGQESAHERRRHFRHLRFLGLGTHARSNLGRARRNLGGSGPSPAQTTECTLSRPRAPFAS